MRTWPTSGPLRLAPLAQGGAASAIPASRAKHLLELVRGRDLELVVAAVDRPLVGTPSREDGRVPKSRALHVIVFHLAYAFDAKRFPRQIFPRAPAALAARHARRLPINLGPFLPWMIFESPLAQRRQLLAELPALRHRERRRDADVMQLLLVVV